MEPSSGTSLHGSIISAGRVGLISWEEPPVNSQWNTPCRYRAQRCVRLTGDSCHGHVHKSIFLFSLLSPLSRHWGTKIRWSVTCLASLCICHVISHVTGQVLMVT